MNDPKKIGRYEVIGELGRGAMGTVYRAKDPAMDRIVALKTIIALALESQQGSEFRERFYREARAAGALAHPGIVPVFDVGEHEGTPYLVMEYVTGRTLADVVEKSGRLPVDRVCEMGQKIAEAIGYAHEHGVVHRDIKPANILITARETYGIERPKITDFGVAKLSEGQTTLTGQMVGTPAFMPPEQFTGAPIDGRADIYSLGVVLYWLATGERPFSGDSMTAVSYKVVHTEPVPPRKLNPALPARFDQIILKCLAKNPDERYQTGGELAHDLGALRNGTKTGNLQSAPPAKDARRDPNVTLVEAVAVATGPAAREDETLPSAGRPAASLPQHRTGLVLAGAALVTFGVGWYFVRSRPHATVETAVSVPAAAEATSTAAPLVAPPPTAPSLAQPTATATELAPVEAPKKQTAAPSASAIAGAKKLEAKTEIETSVTPPAKKIEILIPAAVGFDPTSLDPKQNARLKIDADNVPAALDFTIEMNGKVYYQKTAGAGNLLNGDFFVPPGVQEFRVTANNGAVQKASNTVSAEFKAKKRNALKIELRTQGALAGAGVPQGLYPDTQLVLTLK